jgi:hypothetical protein
MTITMRMMIRMAPTPAPAATGAETGLDSLASLPEFPASSSPVPSVTSNWNVHVWTLLDVSLATAATKYVPRGYCAPLVRDWVTDATSTLSVATGSFHETATGIPDFERTEKSSGHLIVGFSLSVTVILKVHDCTLLNESVAENCTFVTPTGKEAPGPNVEGVYPLLLMLLSSVTVGAVHVTMALLEPASVFTLCEVGQSITGGVMSTKTSNVKVHECSLPAASLALAVTTKCPAS